MHVLPAVSPLAIALVLAGDPLQLAPVYVVSTAEPSIATLTLMLESPLSTARHLASARNATADTRESLLQLLPLAYTSMSTYGDADDAKSAFAVAEAESVVVTGVHVCFA